MREPICDRCWNIKLQKENFDYYIKIKNFLTENHFLFCKCNRTGISQIQAQRLEMEYNLKKNQTKF